jgi:hypothetical protein
VREEQVKGFLGHGISLEEVEMGLTPTVRATESLDNTISQLSDLTGDLAFQFPGGWNSLDPDDAGRRGEIIDMPVLLLLFRVVAFHPLLKVVQCASDIAIVPGPECH